MLYSRCCSGFNLFHVLIFNLVVMQVIKQEGLSRTASECTLFDLFKFNDVTDDEHLTREEFYAAFGECWVLIKCWNWTKLREIFNCIISTVMAECTFSNCDTYFQCHLLIAQWIIAVFSWRNWTHFQSRLQMWAGLFSLCNILDMCFGYFGYGYVFILTGSRLVSFLLVIGRVRKLTVLVLIPIRHD